MAAPYYVQALDSGLRWSSPMNITYSFEAISGKDPAGNAWKKMSTATQALVKQALAEFEHVANVHFVQTTATSYSSVNIAFRVGTVSPLAGLTTGLVNKNTQASIDSTKTGELNAILHEVGHAMGLTHPGADSPYDDTGDSLHPLFINEDSYNATVMSYFDSDDTKWGGTAAQKFGAYSPHTLQCYDIAALQYMYGANHSYHSDNTTYSYSSLPLIGTIWDGGGIDTIQLRSTAVGIVQTIDLKEGVDHVSIIVTASNDLIHSWIAKGANIENAIGGDGSDIVYGNGLNNTLTGGGGNDTLHGDNGNDSLIAGAGTDSLYGDAGNDTLMGDSAGDRLYGGDGDDTLNGGPGQNFLYGGAGSNTINAGSGNDQIYAGDGTSADGTNYAYGNKGNDKVAGGNGSDRAYGGDGTDNLSGGNGNDMLYGDAGNDTINGDGGNDVLSGLANDDYLYGGAGADSLNGGLGVDRLYGGAGADQFWFLGAEGQDFIGDFEDGVDKLYVSSSGTGLTAANVASHISYGEGVAVAYTGGSILFGEPNGAFSLTAADFIFIN